MVGTDVRLKVIEHDDMPKVRAVMKLRTVVPGGDPEVSVSEARELTLPATFGPSEKAARAREAHQARSKRSRFITLVQAATKSRTSFSLPSALA